MDDILSIAIRIDALVKKQGAIISAMQKTLAQAQAEIKNIRTGMPTPQEIDDAEEDLMPSRCCQECDGQEVCYGKS